MKDCTFVGMDKDTTQLELYKHFIGFFLPEGKNVILNVYPLVASGTRYSAAFAAFLKEALGYDTGDSTLPW